MKVELFVMSHDSIFGLITGCERGIFPQYGKRITRTRTYVYLEHSYVHVWVHSKEQPHYKDTRYASTIHELM